MGAAAPGRLTRRAEFLAAAGGRRFHTGRMTVQGLPKEPGQGLRFGFTVTKRVGHATERNRIRRRLRVAARAAADGHPALPQAPMSFDLVVVARREALDAPFPLLVEDLGRAIAAVTAPGGDRRPRRREASASTRAPRSDPPSRTP